jgi:N-acetylglucosamine-6-phosphate deacetylase
MSQVTELDFTAKLISTGEVTRVETQGSAIRAVDEILRPAAMETFLAPGFIDLQVNGFAGVDYNDPGITTAQLAASIRSQFSTGACFPPSLPARRSASRERFAT